MKCFSLLVAALLLVSCGGSAENESSANLSPIMKKALYDKGSLFYADFENYPKDKSQLPIGVFDSGTGGLTVLERLLELDRFNNITGEPGADGILDFEGEDFSYLADQANMPYGNYSSEKKDDYLKELVVKDALALLSSKYAENSTEHQNPKGVKKPVKIIVIACNTATSYGLQDISTLLELSGTGVKVIGVVNAGVNAFLDFVSDTLKENATPAPQSGEIAVGVLATVGTIASGAYERTMGELQKERLEAKEAAHTTAGEVLLPYAGKINVVNYGAAGFAESVDMEPDFVNRSLKETRESYRGPKLGEGENDIKPELLPIYNFHFGNSDVLYKKSGNEYTEIQLNSAANYARFHLVSLFEKYRQSGNTAKMKAVILGCTHYPFLLDTLKQVMSELAEVKVGDNYLYRDIIAPDFTFIDPAIYTAIECYNSLRQDKLLALKTTDTKLDAYISVPAYGLPFEKIDNEGNLTYDFKYGREIGTEDVTTLFVPFSRRYINSDNLKRIEARLPYSYKLINEILK